VLLWMCERKRVVVAWDIMEQHTTNSVIMTIMTNDDNVVRACGLDSLVVRFNVFFGHELKIKCTSATRVEIKEQCSFAVYPSTRQLSYSGSQLKS
jgi:hypothetical protein